MAILKYTTADGQTVRVNGYKVNNIVPVQEKGQSEELVMSQKAVTDEIDEINNTLSEVASLDQVEELANLVSTKANKSNVYTKDEADDKFLTDHQSLADYAKTADVAKDYQPKGAYLTASDITGKADKSSVYTKTEADGKFLTQHQSLSDYAKTKDVADTYQPKGEYLTAADITGKAEKTDLTAEANRAKAAEKANADNITSLDERVEELENTTVYDCGEY